MEYRSVGGYCAVNFSLLKLPISDESVHEHLLKRGFEVVRVDIIALARSCVGVSRYHRGAKLAQAPEHFDCSSFMKWLYAKRGIWLPRRSIQQRAYGDTVMLNEIVSGDVVFTTGYINYYDENPDDGVGHVGIATGDGTVIHAANKRVGVIETTLDDFVTEDSFRGVRRYVPKDVGVLTYKIPPSYEIESADDIRWIILQSL